MASCPECGGFLTSGRCSCGWQKYDKKEGKHSLYCKWMTKGNRCQAYGTINYGRPTNDDNLCYCLWHFDCLNDHAKSYDKDRFIKEFPFDDKDKLEEYWEKTQGIFSPSIYKQKEVLVEWDAFDELQLKGLIFLGSISLAWKNSPQFVKDAALGYFKSGKIKPSPLKEPVFVKTASTVFYNPKTGETEEW